MRGEVPNENNGKSTRESKKASKQAAVASPGACARVVWIGELSLAERSGKKLLLSFVSDFIEVISETCWKPVGESETPCRI